MSFTTLIVLGLVAGGTIYLGLLVGRFPASRPEWRTALSMFAAGILLSRSVFGARRSTRKARAWFAFTAYRWQSCST